jgi:hypothetical protein
MPGPETPPGPAGGGPPGPGPQMGGMPGTGPEMGGMPGMGMPGAAAGGGGPFTWSENPMPEELTITYDQFVAEQGLKRANIPKAYLTTKEGKPAKRSRNAWWQLHRIYSTEIELPAEAVKGTPGARLERAMLRELAAKENEVEMVRRVYRQGLNLFTFEMSGPHPHEVGLNSPDQGGFACLLAVRVNSGAVRRLLALIEREFSKYSHYGYFPGIGRQPYRLVTWRQGVWQAKTFWLSNEALEEWNRLWSQNVLRVRAYGTDGSVLAEAQVNLGHTGTTPSDLLYPPEMPPQVRSEKWVLDLPVLRTGFEGAGINWRNLQGWLYLWSVSGPLGTVAQVDVAEAALVGANGQVGALRRFGRFVRPGVKPALAAPEVLPLSSSLEGVSAGATLLPALVQGRGAAGAGPAAGGAMGMPGAGPAGPPGMMGPGPGPMGGVPGLPSPAALGAPGPGYAPEVPPTAAMLPGI